MTRRPLTPRALVSIALVPNLLLGAVAAPMGTRAFVHLEYLVLALLAAFVSRAMLGVLLGVTLTVDMLFSFAPIFNFGPGEIVAAVDQLRHFRGRAIAFALAVAGTIAALTVAIVRLAIPRQAPAPLVHGERRTAAVLLATAAALVGLDVANGTNTLAWRPQATVRYDVTTSLFDGQYARGISTPPEAGAPMRAATDALRAVVRDSSARELPARIVLVMVEAMGMPRSARATTSPRGLFLTRAPRRAGSSGSCVACG